MKRLTLLLLLLLSCFSASALEWFTNRTFQSESAKRKLSYDIFLPSGYNWRTNTYYPVIYMLHGRDQSPHTWYEEAYEVFMRTKHTNDFIVVFPQGSYWDGALYVNTWYEYRNGIMAATVCDLQDEIASKYRVKNVSGIDGISMGGYAAFRIAGFSETFFNRRYSALGAMSAAFVGPKISKTLDHITTLQTNELAAAVAPKKFMKIHYDCGDHDIWLELYNLAEVNMDMANCLMALGRRKNVDLVFTRPEGGHHDWNYWRARIPEHLDFFAKELPKFPDVKITSHKPYSDIPAEVGPLTIAGTAGHESGITKVVVRQLCKDVTTDYEATGTENWSCEVNLKEGANRLRALAIAGNGQTNWCGLICRVAKEGLPEIELLSHVAGATAFTYDDMVDVYGTAHAKSGISNLWISVRGPKGEDSLTVLEPSENWSAILVPFQGKNAVRVYAVSGSGLTNKVAFSLFRGNTNFRIKKTVMNPKRNNLTVYVSNFTQTNAVWQGEGGGAGSLQLGGIDIPIFEDGWLKANDYVSNYKKRTADEKVTAKLHAKPNKDFIKYTVKLLTTNSAYWASFQNLPFNQRSDLKVKLGSDNYSTNVFLDSTGKFKNPAPWF